MSETNKQEDFQDVRRLIALKRAEQPPQDFHENFLQEFQQRQRNELMRRSSLELLWERIETRLGGGIRSRFAVVSAATACAAVAVLAAGGLQAFFKPSPTASNPAPANPPVQPVSHGDRALPVSSGERKTIRIQIRTMPRVDLRSQPNKSDSYVEF